jgi:L-asparaginase
MIARPRIAHLAGPNATIQNMPPLVTSNKARLKYGMEPLVNSEGTTCRFDVLRPQRLAAPVKVYVEQFSAHPLEKDAAELYGPPDGYMNAAGQFSKERRATSDKPVYEIDLKPEDGVYPLPYMARQADGGSWEEECAYPGAPDDKARQPFFPDGSRSFEEIDRLQIGANGQGNLISSKADIDFYRVLPPGGYRKGLPAERRLDVGEGPIPSEGRGVNFFPYKPLHLLASPNRQSLARAANAAQRIMSSGKYDGAIWTEGSPSIEETIYWLNLLVDTTLPICGIAAQRPQGQISNDGPKNIVDSIEYITSRIWADENGCNRVFAARAIMKLDARPGGYDAVGGHGGVLGAAGHDGKPLLHYLPTARHTYTSEVNVTRLPSDVLGVRAGNRGWDRVNTGVKGPSDELLEAAIPKVSIVKDASYLADGSDADLSGEVDLIALIDYKLKHAPLAGFVVEGWAPYGTMTSTARQQLMLRAIHSGMPVVRVGRGNSEGFVPVRPPFIGGSNLTATKARMLLMACLMKFGSLPPAADPDNPTSGESNAVGQRVADYQRIFDTH